MKVGFLGLNIIPKIINRVLRLMFLYHKSSNLGILHPIAECFVTNLEIGLSTHYPHTISSKPLAILVWDNKHLLLGLTYWVELLGVRWGGGVQIVNIGIIGTNIYISITNGNFDLW